MKKINNIILIMMVSLLAACGGGGSGGNGGNGSPSDFAPADQAAFNAKLVGETIIILDNTNFSFEIDILPDSKSNGHSGANTPFTYTVDANNANKATFVSISTAVDSSTSTLTMEFTFTTSLTGNYVETAADGSENSKGTFSLGFSPADETAFNTRFVGKTLSITSSDNFVATFIITEDSKFSDTYTDDGVVYIVYGNVNYSNIGLNKASISFNVDHANIDGKKYELAELNANSEYAKLVLESTFIAELEFTSILSGAGTYKEACSDCGAQSVTFEFDGNNYKSNK